MRVLHLLMPAACTGSPQQSKEGAQRPRVRAWGRGEHVSSHKLVTSTLHEPRVTHEAAQGPVGPWSAQSMACLPPLRSQPACCQDRVIVRGADAVLGRQVGERHGSIEERLRKMEAQLEEKNKELQQVCVLTGRPRLSGRHSLCGGQRCLSPPLPSLPPSVCVCGPIC